MAVLNIVYIEKKSDSLKINGVGVKKEKKIGVEHSKIFIFFSSFHKLFFLESKKKESEE